MKEEIVVLAMQWLIKEKKKDSNSWPLSFVLRPLQQKRKDKTVIV